MGPKLGKIEIFSESPGMVTFPGKKEIRNRLEEVEEKLGELPEELYSLLTVNSGKKMAPEAVAMNLASAFREFEQNHVSESGSTKHLWSGAEVIIDALILDERAADKAKKAWRIMHPDSS